MCSPIFTAKELLVPVFRAGKRVYNSPPDRRDAGLLRRADRPAVGRGQAVLRTPYNYYVDLSQKLWDIQQELLEREGK